MNKAILNLNNGEIINLHNFISFNLEVTPIDDETEEIKVTKYVSTNMDIEQNKFGNLCVARTCGEIVKTLNEFVNETPKEEQESLLESSIGDFESVKNITLNDSEKINVIKMGLCFNLDFNGEDISVSVFPTSNINTVGKMIFVLDMLEKEINNTFEEYKDLYGNEIVIKKAD